MAWILLTSSTRAAGANIAPCASISRRNAEERAKLLALAASRPPSASALGDADEDESEDEEDFEGEQDDEEADDEELPSEDEEPDIEKEEDEDEAEYDHDAFLASLPSVANLEHLSGVTHGDCEQFSRDFGMVLDVEELVPGTEYLLEVSSPGLDRRLQKAEDFRRFTGSLVKLQTFEPVAGNRHWQGRLSGIDNAVLTIAPLEEKKQKKGSKAPTTKQQPVEIALNNVEKANLVPEF